MTPTKEDIDALTVPTRTVLDIFIDWLLVLSTIVFLTIYLISHAGWALIWTGVLLGVYAYISLLDIKRTVRDNQARLDFLLKNL